MAERTLALPTTAVVAVLVACSGQGPDTFWQELFEPRRRTVDVAILGE